MNEQEALQAVRGRIDGIDRELLRLLNQRAECALEVARIKHAAGQGADLYRPEREAQVLRKIRELNPGPLDGDEAVRLFREIMSSCLALEQPITVAYFGPEGTYTHTAARKHFGGAASLQPVASIEEVVRSVESRAAEFGVVPVENSLEGSVNQTLDCLRESSLRICGEVLLEVHHQLLGNATALGEIREVHAHPQALAQCRHWLDANCPQAARVPAASNADGARKLGGNSQAAAIAGEMAASIYGLPILARNIEDDPSNTTRFLVMGHQAVGASGCDLTSMQFMVRNRPGALHQILAAFAAEDISLTRIESRPRRQGKWEYVFFVDIEGHEADEPVKRALQRVADCTSMLRILGSYPRAAL